MMRRVDPHSDPNAAVAMVVLHSFVDLHARETMATVRVVGRGAAVRIDVTLDPWSVHLAVQDGQLQARLYNTGWADEDHDLLFRSRVPADVERVGAWARRQAANVMQALQSTREQEPVALEPLRLLVVDDESILRQALVRMLRDHVVHVAASVDEAREKLAQTDYDGVLLDVVLPGVGGLDYLRELRGSYPEVARRVCLMTANPEMLDGHPSPSLVKPFSKGELLDVLEWFQLTRRTD
ncbi:MAG: response regulator [Proteobacteria bacterium]|nr:response regulator [Pseudomonadota bacterium]MCP4920072.1 response regulator [Pseudomonadota bacterium]